MCWNYFTTKDLYSLFHWYLSKHFEFVSEVNFARNKTSGGSIWTRQFQLKMSKIWFFEVGFKGCYRFFKILVILLALHSHQPPKLIHQSSLNYKLGLDSWFSFILCQPSLNDLSFIFSPPLLHNPPPPTFQSTQKCFLFLLSRVIVK